MNFGSLLIFLGLNKSKNKFLIPRTVSGPIQPEATAHGARRPATRGRLKGWLCLSLATRSGGDAARGARAPGALAAQSPRAAHALDGLVVRSTVARWRLFGDKVLPVSLWGPQGGHRARRSGVELTRAVARWRGSGGCFGQRRSSAGRELQWPVAMEACPCSLGVEQGR
jgi:hypothetical protein